MPTNRAKFHFDNLYEGMNQHFGPYIIFQVGDLSCEPGYHVEKHQQVVYEISYVVSGNGAFFVNNEKYDVTKGTLFLNRIEEYHEIQSSEDNPLRFFYLGFTFVEPISDNEALYRLKKFFDNPSNRIVYNAICIQDIFLQLFTELLTQDFLTEKMIESYIQQILSYTYRIFSQKKYRTYFMNEGQDADEKLVYDVIHYIDTEVESIKGLAALSAEFGYSYTHIAKKFSAIMGENLKFYYTKRRFDKAKEILLHRTSITQTSELLGYKSIHAFSRAFRKQVGMTPTDYIKWADESKETEQGISNT